MTKKELMIMTTASLDHISFKELCEIYHIPENEIYILIENDIVQPRGFHPNEWTFDIQQLKRVQRARRLQHDLEINLQGIALALDLLEEIEELRARNSLFEKHFFKF